MSKPGERRRYKAFISYSHLDNAAGARFFNRLDGYRVPTAFRGRETRFGPVPERLYPLFRDRDELATSHDLSDVVRDALERSDHLIVLCSPNSAASRWVNEEVRLFSELQGLERIHAVIVHGEPPHCFPPALLTLSDSPFAADLRPEGDGWDDGPLKTVAGVIGVGFGELKDREAARRRRRQRVNAALMGGFATLAVAAGASAWLAFTEAGRANQEAARANAEAERANDEAERANKALDRAENAVLAAVEGVADIVSEVSQGSEAGTVTTGAANTLLDAASGMVSRVVDLAPDNSSLLYQQGRLLIEVSRHNRRIGDLPASEKAAAEAREIYAKLEEAGDLDVSAERQIFVALHDEGLALFNNGRIDDALRVWQEGLSIMRRLLGENQDNTGFQRDVAVILNKVGDAKLRKGDAKGALADYEEALGLSRRLATQYDDDPEWLRDVGVSYERVGNARLAAGDRAGAIDIFEQGLELMRKLADGEGGLITWRRDVSVSLTRLGNIQLEDGNLEQAETRYEESLQIMRDLWDTDRGNLEWARDVAVLLNKVGDVRMERDQLDAARTLFIESRDIMVSLVEQRPQYLGWRRDVYVSEFRLGMLAERVEDKDAARKHFQAASEINADLRKKEPQNPNWRRDFGYLKPRLETHGIAVPEEG